MAVDVRTVRRKYYCTGSFKARSKCRDETSGLRHIHFFFASLVSLFLLLLFAPVSPELLISVSL